MAGKMSLDEHVDANGGTVSVRLSKAKASWLTGIYRFAGE